jgi:adenosylmethionine-8-amino-7-oxononanoate aminotransferase
MTTDEIYQAFYHQDARKGFLHSHSYTGNPLACRAALATLDIFEKENVLEKNRVLAKKLSDAFAWAKKDERIINFRQTGMILAFDVKPEYLCDNFSKEFFVNALHQGILVRPIGPTIYIMPPYIINDDEIIHLSNGIQASLNTTVSGNLKTARAKA